jgi:hypothetical protein
MQKWHQSRKLKSRFGARNRFQEPSLELSSQARLAGRYDNPLPTWLLAPIAGLKLPTQIACTYNVQVTFKEIGISPSRPRETDRILCQIVQFSKPTEGQKVIGEDDVSGIGLVSRHRHVGYNDFNLF